MLSETPETFDAVDVVTGSPVDQAFRVTDRVVLTEPLKRIVALEGVRIVDRPFSRLFANHCHKVCGRNSFDHSRVDPSIALQEAKNDTLALRPTSPFPLPPATEIRLVHFNLAREFRSLKFRDMVQGEAELLVDPSDRLVIRPEIICQPVGGLLLVESGDDADLHADHFQAFLLAAQPAFHVASGCPVDLERTAPYALFSPQKVGYATENVRSCLNHKDILMPHGYESN